ncbi:hypothetical protein AB0D34_37015 [Streptomyces sp. NPDC048420]|uniref:hypothetical protein n=1 Tax=Streptomyces sp. NPDC048420 TaxID=3155755 RepID=UPI00342127C1
MNSVVFGNLSVTLTDRRGARLTRLPLRTPDPRLVRLPHGPGVSAPPFVVGREEQSALVRRAVRERGAVEFTGPCGAGKTTLLRNAATVGGCYVRVAGTELEDLLQDLMRQFYVYPGPDGVRLSTEQCARALGYVTGAVVLDDVSLTPEQLDYLRRVLPGCSLVIGATTPVLGTLGTSQRLPGLPEAAAVALLSRELGRYIPHPEMAAVRRLVAAVGGQPLQLRQAGALVRFDGRSFAELAARAESDPGALDELSISAVGPQAKRALAVLALVGGALLPGALVAQMADIAYVAETLESLSARGLAEQAEDRFGLPVCKSESYRTILYHYVGLASALRSLGDWLASGDLAGQEARGAVDAALSLLGIAAEQRQWQAVVRLATVVERVLFVQGHWQAWQNTLAQGITAAQAAGDSAAEAYFTHQQGVQHFLHDRVEHARRLLRRALDLRTQGGDMAGAAVTQANLALLEPPPLPPMPPAPPTVSGAAHSRRLVMAAVAGVVAVLVGGTAIVQAVGGGGGGDGGSGGGSSSVGSSGVGGTDSSGGTTTGETTTGQTTTGQTTTGQTTGETTTGQTTTGRTTGETTTGRTTTGNGGTPITLSGPVITPAAHDFGLTPTYPSVEAPVAEFQITNPNDEAIDLGRATVPGESGFSYADGTCSDRLGANESCTVSVEFAPSRTGPGSDQLTITSGGRSYTAGLTGTGFASLTVRTTGASDRTVTITDSLTGEDCAMKADLDIDNPDPGTPCVFQISDSGQTLTASISDSGFRFLGWSGACVSDTDSCEPVLSRSGEATVTYAARPPR